MAQINQEDFQRLEKERNTVHSKVAATYSVFEMHGEKYFQIDSYGNSDREMPGKISQSFQLDRKTAEYLVNLIIKEFDLK
ncbi:MAG: hypothetical protein PHU69_10120 [Fermentimonas sp.]|nr:hypothetical protein [Fermentimonas sp.]